MKILVTGVKGQLGYDIVKVCDSRGIETLGVDIDEMDITEPESVRKVITAYSPDAVIHCAAYTAVDKAEDNEEICRKVNVVGTENIAHVCKDIGAKMMYFSTDYVFDGQGTEPWKEDDRKAPINIYGQTKYEGELEVQKALENYFILRISWVFGINGANFVKTMIRLGKERGAVSVVNDQIGSPTYTPDLAEIAVDMIQSDKYGVYHVTNEGICSWYDFACGIFEAAGMDIPVSPVSSDKFPSRAKRPSNSRMSKDKLKAAGFKSLPTWQDALKRYMIELK